MYIITELIKNHYEGKNVFIDVDEETFADDKCDRLTTYYDGDNVRDIRCTIFVDESELPLVSVCLFGLCVIPEEKRAAILELLNECNSGYKAKFALDEDNELNLKIASYVTEENAAEAADELCYFCVSAYDEMYPKIMSTIWKDAE